MMVTRKALISLVGSVTLVVTSGVSASAAPPPEQVKPLECLRQFSDNPNYVGEGWVAALVAEANGFTLRCGDELSGVVHIAHPQSTGSVHPIKPEDEEAFVNCWKLTLNNGAPEQDSPGRTRFVYRRTYTQETATAIVDDNRKFTYTLFTSDGDASNNWRECHVIPS